jgi:uncharacterized protein with GYD domain
MPRYVTLVKWTDQGIRDVKETINRAEQAGAAAERMGGRMETLLWTQGAYDFVAIFEFPDDETYTAYALATGMRGNIRTESLRGFTAEEMRRVLDKLP